MSEWTHLTGCIRIDTMPNIDDNIFISILKQKFGNTWSLKVVDSRYELCTIPKGSEGSVQYNILKTGSGSSLSWGLITIWGDLRDYDDPEEIFKWIKESCNSLDFWIRSCCVEVNVNHSKQYLIHKDKTDEIVMIEIEV